MKKIPDDQLIKKIIEENLSSAKEMLAKKYSALVFALAGKYNINSKLNFRDLVGEGMIGLYRAVENVRLKDKKTSFKKFARMHVEQSIRTFIIDCTNEKIDPP